MPVLAAQELRDLAEGILVAAGAPLSSARIVSGHLVESNLVGHDSHGVLRLPSYVDGVRRGQVQPAAMPRVRSRCGAVARIDGRWGWGQLAARLAARVAIEIAEANGVAVVTVDRCNHIGRLGAYVETIADAGMIGQALCNADPAVAAPGGRARLLGTNPVAWAIPRRGAEGPLIVDFATAGVAEGKLRVARDKGERVPLGLLVDASGQPSQVPSAFYEGGALLPFGGHKGFGMSLVIESIGGALSGSAPSILPAYKGGNGTVLFAVKVSAFVPLSAFTRQVEQLCARIRASATGEGGGEILLPGDPESVVRRARTSEGIPIPDSTWAKLHSLASELEVASRVLTQIPSGAGR